MRTGRITVLATFLLLALLAGAAQAQTGGVAASTTADGSSVLLRWALPENRFPPGGFIITRTSSASSTARHVPAPLPREEALALELVTDSDYDYVTSVFSFEAESDLIRALGALSTLVRPELARVAGTIHEDSALRSGTTYTYRVQTVSGTVVGEATVTAGTPWQPVPVTGVRAAPTATGVGLSWNVPAEDALLVTFNIYRSAGGSETRLNADPVFLPAGGGSGIHYTDEDVEVGGSYAYRVEGIDLFGRPSPLSAAAHVTVPDPDAIAAPEIITTESGQLEVTLTWPPVTDPRIAALGVRRFDAPGGEGTLITPDLLPATQTSFTDADVRGGTSYYYALVALDAAGRIAAESSLREGRGVNRIPPAAPDGLGITALEDGLAVDWRPSKEGDVVAYRVWVSRSGEPAEDGDFSYLGVTADTSYRLDVEPGTLSRFSLRVTALNSSAVEGPPSEAVSGRIIDRVAPDAPRLRNVSEAEGAAVVTWEFALDPDIASLNLYRGSDGAAPVLHATGLAQEARGLTDEEVQPGVTYAYTMTAVDHSGNESGPSEAVSVTLRPTLPGGAPVAGLSAAVTGAGVQLSWDYQDGVSWFVQRARAGQDRFVQIAGPVTESGYLDDRGAAGDAYRLQALGPGGQVHEPSEAVTVPAD